MGKTTTDQDGELPPIGGMHGSGCRCRAVLAVEDLDLGRPQILELRRRLDEAGLADYVGSIWKAAAARLNNVLDGGLGKSVIAAVWALARKPCPTAIEADAPHVGWRTYSRPGLMTADERWPDDWDGTDWSRFLRRDMDATAVPATRETVSEALWTLTSASELGPRRDGTDLAYAALANRRWEWSVPPAAALPPVHPDDWDVDVVAMVLAMARAGIPPAVRVSEVRRIAALARRAPEEVLAFTGYIAACDAGEVVPDPATRAVLQRFPPEASVALARRLDMLNSLEPTPPDEMEVDPELPDLSEPPLELPPSRPVAPEDGGPDPLSIVRDLLPGGRGTRGLPPIVYTPTALDRVLLPDLQSRPPTLVVLSGNAGDGKTAFIANVLGQTATPYRPDVNEYDVSLSGKEYRIVLDGSEDTETRTNDDLLADALGPFAGTEPVVSDRGTLIAINKGRLLRFLETHRPQFDFLWQVASHRFLGRGEPIANQYVLVDLNERSSTAPSAEASIFGGVIDKLASWEGWDEDCDRCDAREQCPVLFNIRTLQEPAVRSQLWTVLAAVDLDDRVHVTARHLVTKIASAVVGDGRCPDIRERVRSDQSFEPTWYWYNSIFSGPDPVLRSESTVMDRVTSAYDPTESASPRLDRQIAFALLRGALDSLIEGRPGPDLRGIEQAAAEVTRTPIDQAPSPGEPDYRLLVLALVRQVSRRLFFLDPRHSLAPRFPLSTFGAFTDLPSGEGVLDRTLPSLIQDLNATLGIDRDRIVELVVPRDYARGLRGTGFAMLVPGTRFSLRPGTALGASYSSRPYLESWPRSIVLSAVDADGTDVASLSVPLLMFEIITRAGRGFRPSSQTERSFMVRLDAFYRALSEHPWEERPAYMLYENGRVLSKARLGASEMVFAEA
jgi:hypothetical protein